MLFCSPNVSSTAMTWFSVVSAIRTRCADKCLSLIDWACWSIASEYKILTCFLLRWNLPQQSAPAPKSCATFTHDCYRLILLVHSDWLIKTAETIAQMSSKVHDGVSSRCWTDSSIISFSFTNDDLPTFSDTNLSAERRSTHQQRHFWTMLNTNFWCSLFNWSVVAFKVAESMSLTRAV